MSYSNNDGVLTKKRIVNHRTKQVETSIKRQIVIEDGKIISDSGPQVTTKTLEDSKEEFEEFVVTNKNPAGTSDTTIRIPTKLINDRNTSYNYSNVSNYASKSTPIKTFLFGYNDDQHTRNSKLRQENEPSKLVMHSEHTKSFQKPTNFFYFGEKCASAKCDKIENSNNKLNKTGNIDLDINNNNIDIGDNALSKDDFKEQDYQISYEYSNFAKEKNNHDNN